MIWRLARRYAQELSWEYIHANRVFHIDKYGERAQSQFAGTWRHCFWHVTWSMSDALGSLYAEQHFNSQNKRKVKVNFSCLPPERLRKPTLRFNACFIMIALHVNIAHFQIWYFREKYLHCHKFLQSCTCEKIRS